MKIIEIEGGQGSPAWHSWRSCHITATNASVLMGNNPWESPIQLFEEKLGISAPKEENDAMRRGSQLEGAARMLFEEMMGIEFPPICCEHSDHSWMGASLDGWNEDNKIVLEIKSPGERTHKEAIDGIVPRYYEDQVQHQLACTGGVVAYYVSYRPEHKRNIAVVEIKPDYEYINHLIEIEKTFYYENLCQFKPPTIWKFQPKTHN